MSNEPLSRARRILAVRLDNIGDVIMLGPALRGLKQALPGAHLTLLASPAGTQAAPLLPWIDDVITWRAIWQEITTPPMPDADKEEKLFSRLHQANFDAAFIFTSFSQSPWPPAYAAYMAGIPIRVGLSKEFGGGLLTASGKPPDDNGHQVDRNLAVLNLSGIEVDNHELEIHIPDPAQVQADHLLAELNIHPGDPFVLMAPGASCSARRYDPHRFAVVALDLAATGIPVVIAGTEKEAARIGPVTAIADGEKVFSLVGETTVPEFAGLIRRSSLVIANNSSALHLADALGRPMVIIYSGTEAISQWEPRKAEANLLHRKVFCSPCHLFNCIYERECLEIPPEEVVEAALELLAKDQQLVRPYPTFIPERDKS